MFSDGLSIHELGHDVELPFMETDVMDFCYVRMVESNKYLIFLFEALDVFFISAAGLFRGETKGSSCTIAI